MQSVRGMKTITVILALCAQAMKGQDAPKSDSARIGNLVVVLKGITVTRVDPNPFTRGIPQLQVQGSHFVIVHLHFENAARYPNCTRFRPERQMDFGERIGRDLGVDPGRLNDALDRLEPGKAADGDYIFQAKDGSKPHSLALVPEKDSSFCRTRFSPPLPEVDAKAVYIPLNSAPSER